MAGTNKYAWILLAAVCALVIGVYADIARTVELGPFTPSEADQYYNLLVQGFRSGQLSLKKEAPPGLAKLADPYSANLTPFVRSGSGGLLDTSYYKGRLYLYFGVTPALLLFWPFVALTGHYLSHVDAVAIFCAIGFMVGVAWLCSLWRRYFAEVSIGVVAAGILAFGLATGVPAMLPLADVYEVAICCGYMLTMLALGAIWCALQESERKSLWLAAASAAYGLALGARPNLLPGAVILLVPVLQAWVDRRPIGGLLVAAIAPITISGLGILIYNFFRFNSPFDFGVHYVLAGGPHTKQDFSLAYLWFNVRVYFLQSVGWSRHFPFVQDMTVPPPPPGHGSAHRTFGILANIPFVWFALAAPLAWRNRLPGPTSVLRWFSMTVALLFGTCSLMLCCFCYSAGRFEMELVPPLVLLATVGILGLEQALAGQPGWRRAARCGWALLLVFSLAFNLYASVENHALSQYYRGTVFWRAGNFPAAIDCFEHALRIRPEYAEAHSDLGAALQQEGKIEEAIGHYEHAVRLRPDKALVHYNLAGALMQAGRAQDAINHWEQAVQIDPNFAEAHYNLGTALQQTGNLPEAAKHFEQALQIRPDFTAARDALAHLQANP